MNAESFVLLGSFYGTDLKNVYWANTKIKKAQGNKIKFIQDDFAKDEKFVYFQGEIVEDADPNTFEILRNTKTCKDRNHVWEYYHESGEQSGVFKLEGVNPKKFDPENHTRQFGFYNESGDY